MLLTFSLALITMVPPLSAKDVNKTIKTKISNNAYWEYRGLADKKTPMGIGKITLYVNDRTIDVITGNFNNQTITDAILTFIGGKLVFKGDVVYSVTDEEIVYTISNGNFEVNGKSNIVPVNKSTAIKRGLQDLKLSIDGNNTIAYKESSPLENKESELPIKWKYDFFDNFNDFVGARPFPLQKRGFSLLT